ncbi:hypothetical protein TRFO_20015 [Tritrichomonas foetus]|uniref:Uncharacterized protein n=1 Tax=Tritrichomonas foetus TaxID=1144522 RepID=A0A1J4KHU1_9EUKA|nr:hypothetical protein TRFO_20015 [Tritrichomonas foetus]|eukprot:OHT10610.1 hypothetical protein TRFO_20015 [Tritrichomonas foetus]
MHIDSSNFLCIYLAIQLDVIVYFCQHEFLLKKIIATCIFFHLFLRNFSLMLLFLAASLFIRLCRGETEDPDIKNELFKEQQIFLKASIDKIFIQSCLFQNCISTSEQPSGGAIYSDISSVKIIETTFDCCKTNYGKGGALFLTNQYNYLNKNNIKLQSVKNNFNEEENSLKNWNPNYISENENIHDVEIILSYICGKSCLSKSSGSLFEIFSNNQNTSISLNQTSAVKCSTSAMTISIEAPGSIVGINDINMSDNDASKHGSCFGVISSLTNLIRHGNFLRNYGTNIFGFSGRSLSTQKVQGYQGMDLCNIMNNTLKQTSVEIGGLYFIEKELETVISNTIFIGNKYDDFLESKFKISLVNCFSDISIKSSSLIEISNLTVGIVPTYELPHFNTLLCPAPQTITLTSTPKPPSPSEIITELESDSFITSDDTSLTSSDDSGEDDENAKKREKIVYILAAVIVILTIIIVIVVIVVHIYKKKREESSSTIFHQLSSSLQ